ncbi:uncharacterized protein IL334_000653 [Kwoniella shivajii]|uniref:Uncharacterized protein n=1 Tax=Kwoniella shivajii TaxID=564305 RepID=A0ABZ1CPR0_9TREE|nr:hypothetical protein IL334_000653 [Kwoniella shivajii]
MSTKILLPQASIHPASPLKPIPVLQEPVDLLKRSTIPFFARRPSRFIPSPSVSLLPSGINDDNANVDGDDNADVQGEVPLPRLSITTPQPLFLSQPHSHCRSYISHDPVPASDCGSFRSYGLSQDSALRDFFRGSIEVTPLPEMNADREGYFIGWDMGADADTDADASVKDEVECISEAEAGWSKSGVRGGSLLRVYTEFMEEGEARKEGPGWGSLTI